MWKYNLERFSRIHKKLYVWIDKFGTVAFEKQHPYPKTAGRLYMYNTATYVQHSDEKIFIIDF